MSRTTIDFGIDLGTTNSAIAMLKGTITEIIKNNEDRDITSSAVHISKRGQLRVGSKARDRLTDDNSVNDAYTEFKRRMGTDHVYEFRSSGESKTPEELSSEVLKDLKGNIQQRLAGEDIQAAVITVPAAFEQRQCAATKRAGELAGLVQCPLVQEPVAAALAYGFQIEAKREYWLIYDFGGGTFDAALMKADDGVIDVVNHGGDNHLGGADIDWAIVDKIILPQIAKEFNFPDLHRRNARWQTAIAQIKRAVEVAKIELSRSETTYLTDCMIKDDDGKVVEIDFQLTRNQVDLVSEPIIMRSIDICRRVLKEKDLAPSMVNKVILVGGPTLAPYFRAKLSDGLGVPLDYSMDPLTVVARGAAIFAGTQLIEWIDKEPIPKGTYRLDFNYTPIGYDEDFTVRGKVIGKDNELFEGYTIQFANQLSKWESGRIPIKSNGAFKAELIAERGEKNTFSVQLFNKQGTSQEATPDELVYTTGMPIDNQTVINSLGVKLLNNEFASLISKGTPLPARKTDIFRTSQKFNRGDSGEILSILIYEGENPKADRNRLQGKLTIPSTAIRRNLPAGSEVEVTLMMDESRTIRAQAYITMLDEDFEVVIESENRTPDVAYLKCELRKEKKRLGELAAKAGDSETIETQHAKVSELEELVETAQTDPDAANKAETCILEMKANLDELEAKSKWPQIVEQARSELDKLDHVISQCGNNEHKERAKELRQEVEGLIQKHNEHRLPNKTKQVISLYHDVLLSQDAFWVFQFHNLSKRQSQMSDQSMASRLIVQGRSCIQRGDIQTLRQVTCQLWDLLPKDSKVEKPKDNGPEITR